MNEIQYCNLLQACEWIAFGYVPMDKIHSDAEYGRRPELIADGFDEANWLGADKWLNPTEPQKEYARKIYAASSKLIRAIYDHSVTILGATKFQRNIYSCGQQYVKSIEALSYGRDVMTDELYNCLKNDSPVSEIKNFSENINIDIINNTLHSGSDNYFDICISVAELRNAFPRKPKIAKEVSKKASDNAKHLRKTEKRFLDIWKSEPNRILAGKKYDVVIDNIAQMVVCSVNTAKKYYKKYIKDS